MEGDREPPYYPALHDFNPSSRCHAPLILFSLDGEHEDLAIIQGNKAENQDAKPGRNSSR